MKNVLLIVGIAVGLNATVALAEHDNMPGKGDMQEHGNSPGGPQASTTMTPELKKDMADMYQKMAECMRSSKTFDQCSQDAMKNCPVVQKTGHCPINEGVGPMMGKRPPHAMESMSMSMSAMNDDKTPHDKMSHHDKMPHGDHAKHDKKKDGDAGKKQPPKSDDQN